MTKHSNDTRRHSNGPVVTAIASGILLAAAASLVKGIVFGISILLMPQTWMLTLLALTGFYLIQNSMHKGMASVVMPVITGATIAVSSAIAVLSGERLSYMQITGILL